MTTTEMHKFLATLAIFLACLSSTPATPQAHDGKRLVGLEDPVFGTLYNPSLVHYQLLSPRIAKICGGFENERTWVYAHASGPGNEYFIVMSVRTDGKQDGDSFGTAIWLKGTKCQFEESKWLLSGTPPKGGYGNASPREVLPGFNAPTPPGCNREPEIDCNYKFRTAREEALVRSLVDDALQRGVAAYRSKHEFQSHACRSFPRQQSIPYPRLGEQQDTNATAGREGDAYPIVNQQLARFCYQSTPPQQ